MRIANKNNFLKRSTKTLGDIFDMLEKLPILRIEDLQSKRTALMIIDMINGFAREGALKSSRVEELISRIVELSKKCDELEISM